MLKQRAVLFDMDGVILDSMRYHVRAWQRAMAEKGFYVPARLFYLHEGAIEPGTAAAIFQENGCPVDQEAFQRIHERQREIFVQEFMDEVRPFPGVFDLLETLRSRGWEVALVTSSHSETLNRVLPSEIRRLISCLVAGDQVSRRKPFPDPYIKACNALKVPGRRCRVVENAPAGIKAAKAAGLLCLALTTTLPARYLEGADLVLSSHSELRDHLLRD